MTRREMLTALLGGSGCLSHVLHVHEATSHTAEANANPAGKATSFPQYHQGTISSNILKAWFYLPDAQKGYYRGTRFDWSGMISRVDYQGHTFFSEFSTEHDPLNHDDVCGTAEEFSMTVMPPGFEQAAKGDKYMKIGVGVLEKGEDPHYSFEKKYSILQAGDWIVTPRHDRISFEQALQGPDGWSYRYEKRIRVGSKTPEMTITRRLKNTGSKPIDTDHYGHNFLKIDEAPAGPDYELEFPFTPRFGEGAQLQGCIEIKGHTIAFLKEVPQGKAVWFRLAGFERPEDNRIRIVNRGTGAGLTIITDQPLARLAFYSSRGVLCPEPFVKLAVQPGETKEWTTTYRFEAKGR